MGKMELNNLAPFVLMVVLVGMVLGVGILTFEKTKLAVPNTGNIVNDSFNPLANTSVALSHGNISAFTQVINDSQDVISAASYTVDSTAGTINFTENHTGCGTGGDTCYATYTYKEYSTVTATALDSVSSEVSGISSNWLGLVVTVLVLAIILGLVIRSFGSARR